MTILLLIRHGENDLIGKRLAGRMPGVHLNERGRRQAAELASVLCQAPIKAIYSSPLERAIETAQPLAEALGLPIQVKEGLEEVDFGAWQGITLKQMGRRKLFRVVQRTPSEARFPGGESVAEAQRRITTSLEEIATAHEEEDLVACFTHSDPIKLAAAHFLGLPLDNFQRLSSGTCSVTAIHVPKEGTPHLFTLNHALRLEFPKREEEKKKE